MRYIHVDGKEFERTRKGKYNLITHESVYPPSEDSFFLIDNLDGLTKACHGIVAEPCTGSGMISIRLALEGANVVSSDVNFFACYATKENLKENAPYYSANVVCGDLLEFIRDGSLSCIVCNPPYLPEYEEGLDKFAWWKGGKTGIEAIAKLIISAKRTLSDGGKLSFLASSLTDLEQVENILRENDFLIRGKVAKELPDERLIIFEAVRKQ